MRALSYVGEKNNGRVKLLTGIELGLGSKAAKQVDKSSCTLSCLKQRFLKLFLEL